MVAKTLDVVRLADGRSGTVIEIFDNGVAYLVEITDKSGKTVDTPIIARDDIQEIVWRS